MDLDLNDLSHEDWGRWFSSRGCLDISLLLFVVWDPIGVGDVPEAHDEYDSYAAACLDPVRRDDPAELARLLAGVEQRAMGFTTTAAALGEPARKIVQGARASAERWMRDDPSR